MQKMVSLVAGFGTMAMLAAPGASAMTTTPVTGSSPVTIDPAIVRAAVAPTTVTATPTNKGVASGTDTSGVKCVVKFFDPDLLKVFPDKHDWKKDKDVDPVLFLQTKLICTDTVGVSEILIEQNDQLVVAGTVTNNQTDVTLHNITVKLNEEQQDTFCVAVARQNSGATTFSVVAQECFQDLGKQHHKMSKKGWDSGWGGSWDSGWEGDSTGSDFGGDRPS
jgi:hypothetical protein